MPPKKGVSNPLSQERDAALHARYTLSSHGMQRSIDNSFVILRENQQGYPSTAQVEVPNLSLPTSGLSKDRILRREKPSSLLLPPLG